jgi:ABC-type amino acid transport system permease subunit
MYVPAWMVMAAVDILGGFSADLATPVRLLILAAALSAIAGATFLLARTIKRAVLRN